MSTSTDKLTDLKKASAKKSKRVQPLITPELFDKLKRIKEDTGASVNEIITQAIESSLRISNGSEGRLYDITRIFNAV